MLQIIRSTDKKALDRLLRARQTRLEEAEPVARRILDDVRRHGDRALVRYARQFDGVDLRQEGFTVSAREVREACRSAPRSVIAALRVAARNIRAVAARQLPRPWQAANGAGIKVGQLVRHPPHDCFIVIRACTHQQHESTPDGCRPLLATLLPSDGAGGGPLRHYSHWRGFPGRGSRGGAISKYQPGRACARPKPSPAPQSIFGPKCGSARISESM